MTPYGLRSQQKFFGGAKKNLKSKIVREGQELMEETWFFLPPGRVSLF